MSKKEEMPKNNRQEREKHPKDKDYNPDITSEDKEVLNNQSRDQQKGGYFNERQEPLDYSGEDLDLPEMDDKKFNQTKNEADESTKEERTKESANSNDDIKENTDTVYKGENAEKYRNDKDNSKKDRHLRKNE